MTAFLHVMQTKYFYFQMFFIMLAYYERNVILSQDTNVVITVIVHSNAKVWLLGTKEATDRIKQWHYQNIVSHLLQF